MGIEHRSMSCAEQQPGIGAVLVIRHILHCTGDAEGLRNISRGSPDCRCHAFDTHGFLLYIDGIASTAADLQLSKQLLPIYNGIVRKPSHALLIQNLFHTVFWREVKQRLVAAGRAIVLVSVDSCARSK